jgi:hypothetical protein
MQIAHRLPSGIFSYTHTSKNENKIAYHSFFHRIKRKVSHIQCILLPSHRVTFESGAWHPARDILQPREHINQERVEACSNDRGTLASFPKFDVRVVLFLNIQSIGNSQCDFSSIALFIIEYENDGMQGKLTGEMHS